MRYAFLLVAVAACQNAPTLAPDAPDAAVVVVDREPELHVEHAVSASSAPREVERAPALRADGCNGQAVMPCWCFDLDYATPGRPMGCKSTAEVLDNMNETGFRPPPGYRAPGGF